MLVFQTGAINSLEKSVESPKICGCCKDVLEVSDHLYIKLSCGHEYHYDCICDAFQANKQAYRTVLECPYCRKKVKPLELKDGFTFAPHIHSSSSNPSSINSWSKEHMGKSYCCFKHNNKYCNQKTLKNSDSGLCWKHFKHKYAGEGHCKYMDSSKVYCNLNVDSGNLCQYHSSYTPCKYVYQKGENKDKICGIYVTNPKHLCPKHLKFEDKIDKMLEKQKEIQNQPICSEIIKRGKRKGEMCGVHGCKRHKQMVSKADILLGVKADLEFIKANSTEDIIKEKANNSLLKIVEINV